MRFKTPVDLPEPVAVPERVHIKLGKILRGARAIDVRAEAEPNRFLQANRINLELKDPKTMPEEEPSDIAEAVCQAMHAHWIDKYADEEAPEPIRFKIVALLHKEATRATAEFLYTWDPSDLIDRRFVDDEENEMRAEMLDWYRHRDQMQFAYIEELHGVVLRQASMQTEPVAVSSEIAKWGGTMALNAMQGLLSAHKLTYDHEAARAKEEEQTKRSEKTWDRLGGLLEAGVKVAAKQFGKWAGEKAAKRASSLSRNFGIELDDEEPEVEEEETEDGAFDEEMEEGTDADARASSHPICTLCAMFHETMTAQQQKKLRQIAPDHYDDFLDLFCVTDEDEAVELWDLLESKLSVGQLAAFASELKAEQRMIFGKIGEKVALRKGED